MRQAHLDELVQVPLLATIAAIIFERYGDRPLPDNQYELYEAYLELLRSAHPSNPTPFDEWRNDLLEHLGKVRLVEDTSLVDAARELIIERARTHELPAGWQSMLTAFLTAVGPLVNRNDELRFLHHTFAEHLAATADARVLPNTFDPDQDAFATLLHTALQDEPGRHARTVLLHWTRLHGTGQADSLVRWLHAGTSDQQLLAARLLARHIPASAETINDFLALARAWAKTTYHTGHEILHWISRAAHHPGLARWLVDLANDQAAPWPSRVATATALAGRLHSTHADAAAAMLRAIVHNEALPVEDRLSAAEGLAECGVDQQKAAAHGLRTLIAESSVPAHRRRIAAVILAALGEREHAVEVLTTSLNDPATPVEDVVEAATGLTEINAEFHDRSADVFRTTLQRRGRTMLGRKEAAIGLAALGPTYAEQAVAALIDLITDRTFDHFYRLSTAEILIDMGPQYRRAAGTHLLDILAEPGIDTFERRIGASALGRLGAEFRPDAIAHLRAAVTDRGAHANAALWAARSLAELGPDVHDEAAQEFYRLATDPLVTGFEHASALSQLARLGDPHRAAAVDRLRTELHNRDTDPETRCRIAEELVGLGPEFHTESAEVLQQIITAQPDPEICTKAWSTLVTLDPRFGEPAAEALLAVLQSRYIDGYTLQTAATGLAELGPKHRHQAATALIDALADTTRSGHFRSLAADALIDLDPKHHRIAVDGLLALLREENGAILRDGLPTLSSIATALRAELADAAREWISMPHEVPSQTVQTVRWLAEIGFDDVPEVVASLQAVIWNPLVDAHDRVDAANQLAAIGSTHAADAIAVMQAIATTTQTPYDWERAVRSLADLGADPVPFAHAVLADLDAPRALRETAATTLLELCPQAGGDAVAELRLQAEDLYVSVEDRSSLIMSLANIDPSTRDKAIAYHRTLLDSEDEPVETRCHAAGELVQLDRACWPAAVATLRRLTTSSFVALDDNYAALVDLDDLMALRPGEGARSALAVINDPTSDAETRQTACAMLPRQLRVDVQRTLLNDYAAPIGQRVPEQHEYPWDNPLGAETEAALREVLDAVESRFADRVKAAEMLARLSPRLADEAGQRLEFLSHRGDRVAFTALTALAWLDERWRRRVRDTAEHMVADDSRPQRDRRLAAHVAVRQSPTPSSRTMDFLRAIAADPRIVGVRRVEALVALVEADGPGPLRPWRDNDQAHPAARWKAANGLVAYRAEDRAASARVLCDIAIDSSVRGALRWRVAEDLAELGAAGREMAVEALRSIMADATVPVTARAAAARLAGRLRPSLVPEAMAVLRGLVSAENPLHRCQILIAMAVLDSTAAWPSLRAMAHDRTLGPVARLRCAEALVQLRRDQREAAAIVAREVMLDEGIPCHIRSRAAHNLTRWSDLCRNEARETLRSFYA